MLPVDLIIIVVMLVDLWDITGWLKKEYSSQIITEADRLCELAVETVYMLGANNQMTPDSPPPESEEANQRGLGDEERL